MPKGKNDKNLFIETLEWICHKLESTNIPYMDYIKKWIEALKIEDEFNKLSL